MSLKARARLPDNGAFNIQLAFYVALPPLITPYQPQQKYCKCAWRDGLLLWQPEIDLLLKRMRKWMRKVVGGWSRANKRKRFEKEQEEDTERGRKEPSVPVWGSFAQNIGGCLQIYAFWKGQAAGSLWRSVGCFCRWRLFGTKSHPAVYSLQFGSAVALSQAPALRLQYQI